MSKSFKIGMAIFALLMFITPISRSFTANAEQDTPHQVAIEYLSVAGILQGFPDGTFRPNNEITRAEFVAVALTAFDDRINGIVGATSVSFSDISEHWAEEYIITAANMGYMAEFAAEEFLPDEKITYEQAFAIIVRIIEGAQSNFPVGYLTFAMREGMTDNIPIVTGANITRGEVAQIIYNVISRERFEEIEREAMATLQNLGQQSPDLLYDLETGLLLRPPMPPPMPALDIDDAAVSMPSTPSAPPVASSPSRESAPTPPPPSPGRGRGRPDSSGGNQFLTTPESEFLSPISSPLSTFALDVNTAAYSFIRRSLHQGNLPNRSVVRIEEMINYFSYDLPRPATARHLPLLRKFSPRLGTRTPTLQ